MQNTMMHAKHYSTLMRPDPGLTCASSSTAPPTLVERLDCYMAASIMQRRPWGVAWHHDVRRALHNASDLAVHPHSAALARAAHAQAAAMQRAFAGVRRWHLVTQNRLFADLRALWPDDRPRRFVDLGCHAGAGRHKNLSDALIWLQYFNASGGEVLGVDAIEDFAQDLQHRLDAPPFGTACAGVRRRAVQLALHDADDERLDLFFALKPLMTCCGGGWCKHWDEPAWQRTDHHCRLTRARLGVQAAPWPPPPSSYPPSLFSTLRLGNTTRRRHPPYVVPTQRADTLWRRRLGGTRIDVVKCDVDKSWLDIGVDGLLRARAFRVMAIEVDASWGWAHGGTSGWGVYAMDQLAWLARRHGYSTYLKVPCRARSPPPNSRRRGGRRGGRWWAAWLFPLANRSFFAPTMTTIQAFPLEQVHDLVLIDDAAVELARLPALAAAACDFEKTRAMKW